MAYKPSNIKKIDPIEPSCRKTMYNTAEDAQDMIRYMQENKGKFNIHAYKCHICGFWHLTSKSK